MYGLMSAWAASMDARVKGGGVLKGVGGDMVLLVEWALLRVGGV